MSESKSPKPESLEAKFRLMTLAPFDKRMKRKHLAVYGFIIDWYHTKYGNALASVRHVTSTMKERDPSGEGFYLGDVHGALTDLVAWGYLIQEKGSGRRASRYIPVWSKSDSVRKSPNTTEDDPSVRETPNTSVRETPNTTADSVRDSTNEDPPTGPGHKTRGHVVGDKLEAAPVAPLSAGLVAADAGTASGDGFDEFWTAWPRKHGIKKARAEWKKIIFDVDTVIDMAGEWAAHYAKHGTDKKWIPEPANWLSGERWLEDLPLIHGDAKGAAIAKAKANAPVVKERAVEVASEAPAEAIATEPRLPPAWLLNKVSGQPRVGSYPVEITEAGIDRPQDGMVVNLTYTAIERPHRGMRLRQVVLLEGSNAHVKAEGHRQFAIVTRASGFQTVNDTDELLGSKIMITIGADGKLEEAAPYIEMEEAA